MTRVNISTLKNELSAVLRKVRRGEEILVVDRDQPVARLVAVGHGPKAKDTKTLLEDLVTRGVASPPKRRPPARSWMEAHLVKLQPGVSAVKALLEEREESF